MVMVVHSPDKTLAHRLVSMLQKEGFVVFASTNIKELRQLLLSRNVCLLIFDNYLESEHTKIWINQLKTKIMSNHATLILSSKIQIPELRMSICAQRTDFLPKPIFKENLIAKIKKIVPLNPLGRESSSSGARNQFSEIDLITHNSDKRNF